MKFELESMVQRDHVYAIVDEVDSILIDEARTPLIISGPSEESVDKYYKVDKIIPRLKKDTDFQIDEKQHTAVLTEEGVAHAEKLLGVDNLYDPANMDILHDVKQAVRAHSLYKKDVEYVVKDGEVIIVDEFTGRLMPGRRWSDGLHQAVEAKEGVRIEAENQTLATITFQNFFRMYEKLAGMTGTADTEAAEFDKIYKLEVVVIPPNKPMIRNDMPDLVYRTEREKFEAITGEIKEMQAKGQPALVGTISIEKSEQLSSMLKRQGVPHVVLNAKYHEKEAEIVAQAGRKAAVTIATNMAGRGTDILLGGNWEFTAAQKTKEVTDPAQKQFIERELREQWQKRPRRSRPPRRPAHPRHRTPRVAPHRQPAARPIGTAGRSRLIALLSVARRRPDADLRVRSHLRTHAAAGHGRRRSHRARHGHAGHRARAEAGRRPQLRGAQTPARIRRRDEQAA